MNKKIEDLQILRSAAIIFVLFEHLSIGHLISMDILNIKPYFSEGVRLFFVISGYVIALSFFSGKEIRPLHFVTKRIFRIYPVLLVFLGFTAVVNWIFFMPAVQAFDPQTTQYYFTQWEEFWNLCRKTIFGSYLTATSGYQFNSLLGAMWSLSVEFQFYALVVLIGAAAHYLSRKKKAFVENFMLILFSLAFVYFSINRFYYLLSGNFVVENIILEYMIGWSFDFLLLGFMMAIAHKKGLLDKVKLPNLAKGFGLVLSLMLLIGPLFSTTLTQQVESPEIKYRLFLGIASPIALLSYALIVYLAATVGCFPGKESRPYKSLYWIGETSYSIYLFHIPVIALAALLFTATLAQPVVQFGRYQTYLAAIFQIIAVAVILFPLIRFFYFKLEKPMINLGHRTLNLLDSRMTIKQQLKKP